jgi:hypothetical protein
MITTGKFTRRVHPQSILQVFPHKLNMWKGNANTFYPTVSLLPLRHQSNPDSTNYLWAIDWNKGGNKIVTGSRYRTIAVWDSTANLLKRIDVSSMDNKR